MTAVEPFELKSARQLASETQRRVLRPGDTAVDCTLGNGHDTRFLAELVGPGGRVIGFDIQREAVDRTEAGLREAGLLDRCTLICAGHEHIDEYVREPVRCVVFNLGWLPGGDKRFTTRLETTERAVRAALALLQPMGVLTLCAYPGHEEGAKELEALKLLFSGLRPQEYNVLHQRFLNAGPGAPECFVIQQQAGPAGACDPR